MNERAPVFFVLGLVLLSEASRPVFAQDAAPAKLSPTPVRVARPAPISAPGQAKDPTAEWARSRVAEARATSRCLTEAAAKLDAAARRHQAATEAQRAQRSEDLDVALGTLAGCEDPPAPRVTVTSVSILGDPCGGDPLCDADVVYEQKLGKLVGQRLTAVRECYRKVLHRHPEVEGDASFEIELGETAPVRVAVVKHDVDELGDVDARACIDRELQKLAFTDGEKGLRFRALLKFER